MRNRREWVAFCLSLGGCWEDYPFDEEWTVMRHRGNRRSFAFFYERGGTLWVNCKCPPEEGDFLRAHVPGFFPGLPHEQDPLGHGGAGRARGRKRGRAGNPAVLRPDPAAVVRNFPAKKPPASSECCPGACVCLAYAAFAWLSSFSTAASLTQRQRTSAAFSRS